MPTPTAALARRIIWAMQTASHGAAAQWISIEVIARIVLVSDGDFLRDALQTCVDHGWLVVEGGRSICLTDSGRRLARPA